jgi:hypothetical protein
MHHRVRGSYVYFDDCGRSAGLVQSECADAFDPLAPIQGPPALLAVPYLLTAIGGLLAGGALDIYSSGLALKAAGWINASCLLGCFQMTMTTKSKPVKHATAPLISPHQNPTAMPMCILLI